MLPSSKTGRDVPPIRRNVGVTLVEIMVALAILAVVATMGFPMYRHALSEAEEAVAEREIREIQDAIDLFAQQNDRLPLSLDEIGFGDLLDPWGNPYQFLNFDTVQGSSTGKARKDRFLVPINSDYDLYSMGPDGRTASPLTAEESRDDIVRASDGDYIGPASAY